MKPISLSAGFDLDRVLVGWAITPYLVDAVFRRFGLKVYTVGVSAKDCDFDYKLYSQRKLNQKELVQVQCFIDGFRVAFECRG